MSLPINRVSGQVMASPRPTSVPAGPVEPQDVHQGTVEVRVVKPSVRPGPVPDFARQSGIVAHRLASDLCQPFVSLMIKDLGQHLDLQASGYQSPQRGYDVSMVWLRDYHPLFVRQADGSVKVVKFLSENPTRDNYTNENYIPVRPPSPTQHFYRIPGQEGHWLETERVPLLHENGNLVSTGEFAFVTDKLLRDNAVPHLEAQLGREGYRPRTGDQVLDLMSKAIGLPANNIVVLPPLPAEKTGHVDLYVMALGERRVMLPEIRDEAFQAITYGHEIQVGRTVQQFLNQQAADLRARGFEVGRLPMMPPTFLTAAPGTPTGWHGVFNSPANSLLVNVKNTKEVILPTVSANGFPDAYRRLNETYQKEWCSFFQKEGWNPQMVDATQLGRAYGLFRCLTYPVPE